MTNDGLVKYRRVRFTKYAVWRQQENHDAAIRYYVYHYCRHCVTRSTEYIHLVAKLATAFPDYGFTPKWKMTAFVENFAVWTAVGFGSGWAPKAPGTFGTVVGLAIAWLVGCIASPSVEAAVVLAICVSSISLVNRALPLLGRGKDPGCIVLDEIAAMPIVFFLIPMTSWLVVVAGFLLFRVFDISKLPPAKQLERLPGGLGVMADDWAAAVYSHLALRALLWAIPSNWIA